MTCGWPRQVAAAHLSLRSGCGSGDMFASSTMWMSCGNSTSSPSSASESVSESSELRGIEGRGPRRSAEMGWAEGVSEGEGEDEAAAACFALCSASSAACICLACSARFCSASASATVFGESGNSDENCSPSVWDKTSLDDDEEEDVGEVD